MNNFHRGFPQQPEQVAINMEEEPIHQCPHCGCKFWIRLFQIRKLSAMHPQNPTRKDQYVPLPIYICRNCNEKFEEPKEEKPGKLDG